MSVKLKNLGRRVRTVLLEHSESKREPVHMVRHHHDPKTGVVSQERVYRTVPRSLTLLGGGTSDALPDWAARCPDVLRLVAQGQIAVVERTAPATAGASAASVFAPADESAPFTNKRKGK